MSEPQGYTQAFVDIMNSKLAQDIMAAFDAGVVEGEKRAEERIIKLLDNHKRTYLEEDGMYCCGGSSEFYHAIALIKGK